MAFQDSLTQFWVQIFGKKINPITDQWLLSPVGKTDIISDTFVDELAASENLEILRNQKNAGLLNSIDQLGLDEESKARLHNSIIDFYENTSNFEIEFWSEWNPILKPFYQLLSHLFSKRLQQLNLPLSTMDSAKGLISEVIKLQDKKTKENKWTIWYRKLRNTGDVIYSGIYTQCQNPNYEKPLLKVIFPLPNGSATVFMTIEVNPNGDLVLTSNGKKFGDNGFYFTLTNHQGSWWAKFVGSMHEELIVYVNSEEELRADHSLKFYGFHLLHLHYKMKKIQNT